MNTNGIKRAVLGAAKVIDRPPVCYIAFAAVMAIMMIAFGFALNDVYPAYQ